METPCPLSARFEGSFAYLTVKDRLPQILTRVIDSVHRYKNQFLEEYGEEGIEAEKKALSFFSKLRNEMQTDKLILPLTDHQPDTHLWNRYLDSQKSLPSAEEPSWFRSPWLYVECYMYRRIQEGMALSPPICNFDVFHELKNESFFLSQQAVMALCTHLHELKSSAENLSMEQRKEAFYKLLQVSLWGNKCDLSISGGQENAQKTSVLASLDSFRPFILVDNMESLWGALTRNQVAGTGTRVDIVLDNAGFELVTDLILADFLLSLNLASEVHFHAKCFPWYVSDTTKHDFDWTIQQLLAANHKWMSRCGQTWKGNLKKGTWVYHENLFWTLPHEFWSMEEVAPDLYAELKKSDLLLFKGDLNYRKLTGDRKWDFTAPFSQVLKGFRPAPLCSIRTLKSDVQVGLEPGVGERLSAAQADWLVSGKYGVIQFCSGV
ncbi:damage-control phosphatase ARMT1 [Gastrophryne carolinensis]